MFIKNIKNFYSVALDLFSAIFCIGIIFILIIFTLEATIVDVSIDMGLLSETFSFTRKYIICSIAMGFTLSTVYVCVKTYNNYRKTGSKYFPIF